MATRDEIKGNFQHGDIPDEAQYAVLVNSTLNLDEDRSLLGLLEYDPSRSIGYKKDEACLKGGLPKIAIQDTGGTYNAAHWIDMPLNPNRIALPIWTPEAPVHVEVGEYLERNAKIYKKYNTVDDNVDPDSEAGESFYQYIGKQDAPDLLVYQPGVYPLGATRVAQLAIWQLNRGANSQGVVDCSEDDAEQPDTEKWDCISGVAVNYLDSDNEEQQTSPQPVLKLRGAGVEVTPDGTNIRGAVYQLERQSVIELRDVGRIPTGICIVTDALEREDPDNPGELLHDEIMLTVVAGDTYVKAFNLRTLKDGTYGLDDGEGGVDTWVEDAGGGSGGGPQYVYKAVLSQPGDSSNPVVSKLHANTFPDALVWTKISGTTGLYNAYSPTGWLGEKPFMLYGMDALAIASEVGVAMRKVDDNNVALSIFDTDGNPTDGFSDLCVLIEVKGDGSGTGGEGGGYTPPTKTWSAYVSFSSGGVVFDRIIQNDFTGEMIPTNPQPFRFSRINTGVFKMEDPDLLLSANVAAHATCRTPDFRVYAFEDDAVFNIYQADLTGTQVNDGAATLTITCQA